MDAFTANPWANTDFGSYAPYASTSDCVDFSVYPSPPLHKLNEASSYAQPQPTLRHAKSCGALPAGPMLTPTSLAGSSPALSDLQTPTEGSHAFIFNSLASPITPTANYSSQPMATTSSIEEVNAFLEDMNSLLGPDTMAQLSTATPARKSSYNVSGVILDEDEFAAYNSSPTVPYGANYAYQPYQQGPAYYAQGPGSAPYQGGSYRPRSAPASPDLSSFGYSWGYATPPPARGPVRHQSISGPVLRRGSSLEALQAQPSRPDVVGMGFYLPHQAPPSIQQQLRRKASLPNPRAVRKPSSSGPSTPTRSVKKKASGTCFINFSASDASVLLSGVAPSGSSKRKRDDDAEPAEKKSRV